MKKVIREHISVIKCQECGSKFEAEPSDFEYVKTKRDGVIVKTIICPCCNGRLWDEFGVFGLHYWGCIECDCLVLEK